MECKMMGRTTDRRKHRVRDALILGLFMLLCVGNIILFLTGGQSSLSPYLTVSALVGSILILGFLAFIFVALGYEELVNRMRGARKSARFDRMHIPSDSLFEINLDGFDSRYEELLRQIDRLPDTGKETDKAEQWKLRGIAVSLKGIKIKLTQMSGTHPYKEDLEAVQKQLARARMSLLEINMSAEPLWRRLRSNAEFRKDLIKAKQETHHLEEMLRKKLMNAKKRKTGFWSS
jgi:hypothetical protein